MSVSYPFSVSESDDSESDDDDDDISLLFSSAKAQLLRETVRRGWQTSKYLYSMKSHCCGQHKKWKDIKQMGKSELFRWHNPLPAKEKKEKVIKYVIPFNENHIITLSHDFTNINRWNSLILSCWYSTWQIFEN